MTVLPDEHPLVINVAGLLGDGVGSVRDFAFDDVRLDLGEEIVQASPARVRAHVSRTNRGLLVHATATTSLAESCSRCLRPVESGLEVVIDDEVLPSLDPASGLRLDTAAEPEVPRLSDHHELDLETLVREAVQLAEPVAPLCRPDCQGLCPECGAELDDGPHEHAESPVDPRLEALRAFHPDAEG